LRSPCDQGVRTTGQLLHVPAAGIDVHRRSACRRPEVSSRHNPADCCAEHERGVTARSPPAPSCCFRTGCAGTTTVAVSVGCRYCSTPWLPEPPRCWRVAECAIMTQLLDQRLRACVGTDAPSDGLFTDDGAPVRRRRCPGSRGVFRLGFPRAVIKLRAGGVTSPVRAAKPSALGATGRCARTVYGGCRRHPGLRSHRGGRVIRMILPALVVGSVAVPPLRGLPGPGSPWAAGRLPATTVKQICWVTLWTSADIADDLGLSGHYVVSSRFIVYAAMSDHAWLYTCYGMDVRWPHLGRGAAVVPNPRQVMWMSSVLAAPRSSPADLLRGQNYWQLLPGPRR